MIKIIPSSSSDSLPKDMLHLTVLWTFAVVQPLLDILARHAEFFVARRAEPTDIVFFVVGLVVISPLLVVGLRALAAPGGPRIADASQRLMAAILVAMTAFPALHRITHLPGLPAAFIAALCGAAVAVLLRARLVQDGLTALSISLVVFPVLFFLQPSIKSLMMVHQPRSEVTTRAEDDQVPIVMVIFDELPLVSLVNGQQLIDPERYPNLAALSGRATWFRNATTVADETSSAVPAMLTGGYPEPGLLATARDYPDNLFTLLGGSYRFRVSENYTTLCPPWLCSPPEFDGHEMKVASAVSHVSDLSIVYLHLFLPPSWTTGLPAIDHDWRGFGRSEAWHDRTGLFEDFVKSIDGLQPAAFNFLHASLPHAPNRWYPSGKMYSRGGAEPAGVGWQTGAWPDRELPVVQSYQRHLLQVGYVDTLVGSLLKRLEEVGILERCLLVITSDHGASYRAGDNRRTLSTTNYVDIMSVPLIIKEPYQTDGRIDDSTVELIDLLPTIAHLLDVDVPWKMDGVSLIDGSLPDRPTRTCFSRGKKTEVDADFSGLFSDSVQRKNKIFGSGNAQGLFAFGPYGKKLVGRRLAELELDSRPDLEMTLIERERFAKVDVDAELLPGEITGYVGRAEPSGDRDTPGNLSLNIAVAVNGSIAGTTETYDSEADSKTAGWSMLVDETVFAAGKNEVEAFVIEETTEGLRLIRTDTLRGSFLVGANLGSEPVPGVTTFGFLPPENLGPHGVVRWASMNAALVVPVDRRDPPTACRLDLTWTGPTPRSMQMIVNDRILIDEVVDGVPWPPQEPWSRTVSLAEVPIRDRVRIKLLTKPPDGSTVFKEGNKGVLVKGLWLLGSGKDQSFADRSNVSFADGFESRDLSAWSDKR